ncbi:hypothetical protein ACWGIU_28965 [Streptomyces sp. NPDC054840]
MPRAARTAEVIGSVVEKELLAALFAQPASLTDPLEKHSPASSPASRCR